MDKAAFVRLRRDVPAEELIASLEGLHSRISTLLVRL